MQDLGRRNGVGSCRVGVVGGGYQILVGDCAVLVVEP